MVFIGCMHPLGLWFRQRISKKMCGESCGLNTRNKNSNTDKIEKCRKKAEIFSDENCGLVRLDILCGRVI